MRQTLAAILASARCLDSIRSGVQSALSSAIFFVKVNMLACRTGFFIHKRHISYIPILTCFQHSHVAKSVDE